MKRVVLAVLALWGLAVLSACQPPAVTPVLVTPVETPTAALASPTPADWFPPTATPTPFPTLFFTPTPDLQAGKGTLLWQAAFADSAHWLSTTPAFGTFGLSDGVMTLTGTRARFPMLVFSRREAGYNFYLQAQARPTVCRGKDAYGVAFRVSQDKRSYFLFGVDCRGYAFVDKSTGDIAVPQAKPQPAPVAPGSLVQAKFEVSAVNQRIYLAVNGQPIFTLRDDGAKYGRGGVGFFVRPATEDGAAAVFISLAVYAAH